ncbi:MAG: histidine kinase N-terminal 7TM domain-containing protein, partial [Candidatus Omnitrophota bacterium]
MSLLPFLHFFCFSVYMILAVYVLAKNAKSLLNRVCSVLFTSFGIWSFGSIFLHSPRTARDAAYLFENIAALGWGSFPVIFLWFVLIFTKRARILGSKLFYAAIAVLPVLFIYKQWSGLIIGDYVFRSYGWSGVWSSSPWAYLYFVYYSLFCGMGLYFLTKYSQHIDSPIIQKRI